MSEAETRRRNRGLGDGHFPGARFVHLHLSGPDSADCMSRRTGFRLLLLLQAMGALDCRGFGDEAPERSSTLDPAAAHGPWGSDRYSVTCTTVTTRLRSK
jgi:hypothetical protein